MILYTLDIERKNRKIKKTSLVYIAVTVFCAIFGMIYEYFSHGVDSAYMTFAFLIPLIGGFVSCVVIYLIHLKQLQRVSMNLYHAGIATLTVGSIMRGILDIYGTTNDLLLIYWFVGVGLIIIAFLIIAFISIKSLQIYE